MSNEHGRINRLQEVEDLTEYINNGWLHSGESDGPTFLWNDMIREASQEDAENRNNVPVAQLSDADHGNQYAHAMVFRFHRRHGAHSRTHRYRRGDSKNRHANVPS